MIDQGLLNLLIGDVKVWNSWRQMNATVELDLGGANLSGADLKSVNLSGTKLTSTNLSATNLKGANFSNADLTCAQLTSSNLWGANLVNANLSSAILMGANLSYANLGHANLSRVKLKRTNLIGTNFLSSNLKYANLTGACIQDWQINGDTSFDNVVCDYIYLRENQQERRPLNGNFSPGEFVALVQKSLETIDLIFIDGIDWQAFFYSFQQLRSQFVGQEIGIQAIEKKGNAFIVRLETSYEANKGAIESVQKELYKTKLQLSEAHGELRVYREMSDVIKTLAGKPMETTQNFNAQVGNVAAHNEGEMNNEQVISQTTINAEKIENLHSGSGNVNNYASPEQQVLVEVATEIQQYLQQLEQSNPAASETDQIQYVNIATKPEFKQRVVSAMQAGGEKALEEFVLENRYLKVIKATIKAWLTGNA
ncbi:pentapeptide repeat-containing protein [Acaryochloris marina]|uniref:Pentapeptide repeat protein n=1 Tax=Acaryochloris marina (strain MBIC 11017) TaxID=329726 RepID=A8ZQZ9_ACAM1|nr:pentapeptide repeat-containing protein [Acaryochloris marina]ABW33435.1 pentapeptide repeat protein [Acaryochloris marina MBIC11017]